jgi:hypothetical protein
VFSTDTRSSAVGQLLHIAGQAPQIVDPQPPAPVEQILEPLAKGPDVDVEDLDIDVGVMFLEHQGALDRVHAADVGAVIAPPAAAPGTHALDETDRLGVLAVRGADQLPLVGPPALTMRSNSRLVSTFSNRV